MNRFKAFVSALAFCICAYATPTWMWVGTYGIDNYSGNGGGGNLTQSIAGANEFMSAADVYCPIQYSYFQRTDADVTHAAVSNNSQRENCDFVYFDGHGNNGYVFLGYNAGYEDIYPSDLDMGTSYNRWAYFYTCLTLHWQNDDFGYWDPAFSGIQTILGFASLTWAVSYKEYIHNQFWNDWVNIDKPMYLAHFDAVEDWLWNYGGLDVGPAMICADNAANNSYDEATSAAGGTPMWWEQRICGDPQY